MKINDVLEITGMTRRQINYFNNKRGFLKDRSFHSRVDYSLPYTFLLKCYMILRSFNTLPFKKIYKFLDTLDSSSLPYDVVILIDKKNISSLKGDFVLVKEIRDNKSLTIIKCNDIIEEILQYKKGLQNGR